MRRPFRIPGLAFCLGVVQFSSLSQERHEMIQRIIFAAASAALVYVSRASLFRPQSHGFYRFYAWEAILALVLLNAPHWFQNPSSFPQRISWLFLLVATFLVVHGVYLLRVIGRPSQDRTDAELLEFEKTSSGI